MASGIKETSELLALSKYTAQTIKAARADGHINAFDAPLLVKLIGPVKDAVDGAALIGGELTDLDKGEVQALLALVVDATYAWLDALGIKPAA